MLKASLYSTSISTALKVTVREPRPNSSDRTSFPSGHSTAAFAFSSFVAAEHGFWPMGLAALGLSTLTGLSRINDNRHFLHDVIAGATIGTAYGLGISYLHKSKSDEVTEIDGPSWQAFPIFSAEVKGAGVAVRF